MQHFFRPGQRLLNRLRYPQKFLLISILLIIPIGVVYALLLSETMPQIEFTHNEVAGARYIQRLSSLMTVLQEGHFIEDAGDSARQHELQSQIDTDLEALGQDTDAQRRFGDPAVLEQLRTLRAVIVRANRQHDIGGFDLTTHALLAATYTEIQRVADASRLTLDPELTSYYLMDLAVVNAPARMFLLSQIDHALEQPQKPGLPNRDLIALAGQFDANINTSQRDMRIVLSNDPTLAPDLTPLYTAAFAANTQLVRSLLAKDVIGAEERDSIITQSGLARNTSFRLQQQQMIKLTMVLQQRRMRLEQKNMLASSIIGVLVICVMYLFVGFYRSVMDAVQILDLASRRLLEHRFGELVTLDTRDELGQVVASFNRVASALQLESNERQATEVQRAELQETIIRTQAETLQALAVPVIPLGPTTLLLPLLGSIDSQRAQQILETVLRGVAAHRARTLIFDMTGVRHVDAQVAQTILQAVHGVRLLGATVVLAGVRAEVAQTMVKLGVDLRSIQFYASLRDALYAQEQQQKNA